MFIKKTRNCNPFSFVNDTAPAIAAETVAHRITKPSLFSSLLPSNKSKSVTDTVTKSLIDTTGKYEMLKQSALQVNSLQR